jgi:hypothetical protein
MAMPASPAKQCRKTFFMPALQATLMPATEHAALKGCSAGFVTAQDLAIVSE